jgi:hypothetical protein
VQVADRVGFIRETIRSAAWRQLRNSARLVWIFLAVDYPLAEWIELDNVALGAAVGVSAEAARSGLAELRLAGLIALDTSRGRNHRTRVYVSVPFRAPTRGKPLSIPESLLTPAGD